MHNLGLPVNSAVIKVDGDTKAATMKNTVSKPSLNIN
jgi:hypothetical protein